MNKISKYSKVYWRESLIIILVIIGLILSFFHVQLGGALVGLGFGAGFADELQIYFGRARMIFTTMGVYKTLLMLAAALYLLFIVPAFVVATLIGFAIMITIRKQQRSRK